MSKVKFLKCEKCGNIVGMIHASGVTPNCCGQSMTPITAKTEDAGKEKHLPVCTVSGNEITVNIGSVSHPMSPEHNISWVYLETSEGGQRKVLPTDGAPTVTFAVADEKPKAVYAYCNLHGLWKTEI